MKKLLLILTLTLILAHTKADDKPFKRSYTNHTEIGVLLGKSFGGVTAKANVSLQSFNGIRLTPKLAVGGIVGLDWYASAQVIPVGVGVRGTVFKAKKLNPFYGLDAGYGLMFASTKQENEKISGGLMLNPSVGMRVALGGGNALTWSIGWKHQSTYSSIDNFGDVAQPTWWWGQYQTETHKIFERLSVKMGITF